MADHNDPNAVNSIFSDIDVSAADLYNIFGFSSADTEPGVLDQTCSAASRSRPSRESFPIGAITVWKIC